MKLHGLSLQSTSGRKPSLEISFWKCSESKGCSEISKISKNLCKTVSSSLMLQACSLEFPVSAKQTPRKMFLVNVQKYFKKRSVIESFYEGNKITI